MGARSRGHLWAVLVLFWMMGGAGMASGLAAPDHDLQVGDQLLVNPGFEQAIGQEWALYPGGTPTRVPGIGHGGDFAAGLTTSGPTEVRLYQLAEILPLGYYQVSAWAHRPGPGGAQVFLRVRWLTSCTNGDTTGLPIESQVRLDIPTTDFQLLSIGPVNAPGNATCARVDGVVDPRGSAPVTVFFDDFSFIVEELPPTATSTRTPTWTYMPLPTTTPVPTATPIPTATPTASRTPSATNHPAATPTPAVSRTATRTPTRTPGPTSTATIGSAGSVIIRDVYYHATNADAGAEAAQEWGEIYNPTTDTIVLAGWTLQDNNERDEIPELSLAPASGAVIAASANFWSDVPNYSGTVVFVADGRLGNGLRNEGDRLALLDGAGTIIDAVSFGDDATYLDPPAPATGPGASLRRVTTSGRAHQANEFARNPSPGRPLPASPTATGSVASTPEPAGTGVVTVTRTPASVTPLASTATMLPTASANSSIPGPSTVGIGPQPTPTVRLSTSASALQARPGTPPTSSNANLDSSPTVVHDQGSTRALPRQALRGLLLVSALGTVLALRWWGTRG